jgi:raffinose/stachyose/melibiose transport system substrate-binding protein
MKVSKFSALVLAICMIFSLVACANNANNPPNIDSTPDTAQTDSPNSGDTDSTTVSFWHGLTVLEDSFEALAVRYEEETGNKVDVTFVENDSYKEKLRVAMMAQETPNIYQHWAGGPMNSYVDAGLALDLTEYMNEDDYKSVWMDSAIAMCTYNDKIYATPGTDLMTFPLFYNTEILEFYGYNEFPKTIAELEELCDVLVADDIIPFALANKNKWTGSVYYMYLVDRYGNGESFVNAANRINDGTFEDDAFTKAGEKLQEWVNKGYFPDGVNGLDNSTAQDRQLLYTGKAAIWSFPTSGLGALIQESPETYDKLDTAMFPVLEEGGSNAVVGSAGQNFFSICPTCEDPDTAWGFLKLLSDEVWVNEILELSYIPPTKDAMDNVSDPLRRKALEFLDSASFVQLAWDQYLTPVLGELHKSTTQELFGLTKTPAEVNAEMEATALEEYDK